MDDHLLPECPHNYASVNACAQTSFLYEDTSDIGLGLTLMASFYLKSPLLKDPLSKYTHMLKYGRQDLNI